MEPGYALLSLPWNGRRRKSYHGVVSNYEEGWVKILNERWESDSAAEYYAQRFIDRYEKFTRRNKEAK